MNTMKATFLAATLAAAALAFGGSANAAPVSALGKAVSPDATGTLQMVDYRPYRHCHRGRYGRRWCHGGYYRNDYYDYGYRPGFSLYLGPRYGHHHRHRHWRHHHRR
jgi:hypothetical protein